MHAYKAGLSLLFWAVVVQTTFYLIKVPLFAIEFKTPQEVWSGQPADISNLRIFGCTTYAHKATQVATKG